MLNFKDLKIETFRARGKGGQNVNKVETAVRITHIPTKTVVTCQDERSQAQNKQRALQELEFRLDSLKNQRKQEKLNALRESLFKGRVRTYDFTTNTVTDHIRGTKTTNIKNVMNGDLSLLSN